MGITIGPYVGTGTRLLVVGSAGAALVFQAWLGARATYSLPVLIAAACVVAFAGGRLAPRATTFVVLASAFTLPALLALWPGHHGPPTETVWVAGLFGLALAFGGGRGWALPRAWRLPLALGALSVALIWPIVAAREIDFLPALLFDHHAHVTHQGIPPGVEVTWILYAALTLMVGALWADGLFRERALLDGAEFGQVIIVPSLVGLGLSLSVAYVQMTVDVGFLNQNFYAYLDRASGLLRDANGFGMLAALWTGAALALLIERRAASQPWLATVVMAAAAAGIWGSASRTALLAFSASVIGGVAALLWTASSRQRLRWAAVIVIMAVVVGLAVRAGDSGPAGRFFERIDRGAPWSVVARQLWDRSGYGSTAGQLIAAYPVSGVGIGSFHALVVDYARAWQGIALPPDNAQSWYRHLIVELGWLGAAFWLWWLGLVVVTIVRRIRVMPARALPVGAALIGFFLASLLGVPAQQAPVFLSVITLACWLRRDDGVAPAHATLAWPAWAAGLAVVLFLTGHTAYMALNELRVPARAATTGWQYAYGWYDLDGSADPPFRWTKERAVAVIPAAGRYLRLRFRVQHPDVASNPVRVRVKLQQRTVVRELLVSEDAIVRYVEVPPSGYVALTFLVSRTFEAPGPDPRHLGVAVDDWRFVDHPPAGAWIVR